MKTYIKPELQVREIRVSENLANNVSWSINSSGQVVTEYGAIAALAVTGSDNGANA